MEKLRTALDSARARRGGFSETRAAPIPAAAPRPDAPVSVRSAEADAAWAALDLLEPNEARLRRKRVVAFEAGKQSGSYDILRTKVMNLCKVNGWKRIVVTSPNASCGKSTTSLNLALSFGRLPEVRIILFDMDMRRPSLFKLLDYRGKHSSASVLDGRTPFEDQALRIGENVAISMNYAPSHHPAELFMRERTARIIDEIEARYQPDFLFFDMPPMLAVDDTSAFLGNAHCALVMAAADVTTTQQLDLCERELSEQTNVLGIVLNKCRYNDDGYSYAYYSYGY